jgi:hypothetical protein
MKKRKGTTDDFENRTTGGHTGVLLASFAQGGQKTGENHEPYFE